MRRGERVQGYCQLRLILARLDVPPRRRWLSDEPLLAEEISDVIWKVGARGSAFLNLL